MNTGILSYGVALPRYRIEAGEIWKVWKNLSPSFFDLLSIGERGVLGRRTGYRLGPPQHHQRRDRAEHPGQVRPPSRPRGAAATRAGPPTRRP